MTFEEFQKMMEIVNKSYQLSIKAAIHNYCDANNPYKIGDIFTDHIGSIKIQAISYFYNEIEPCCIYCGIELKKDGSPRKDGAVRNAYQRNEVKK